MADEYALTTLLLVARDLYMHLGHQRTGSIEDTQMTTPGLVADALRHSVGAEDHRRTIRDLMQLIYEADPLVAQTLHHELVVHHLVADVQRRAEYL